MNVIKIYKIVKTLFTISKIAMNTLEELFNKDLNGDGQIGSK